MRTCPFTREEVLGALNRELRPLSPLEELLRLVDAKSAYESKLTSAIESNVSEWVIPFLTSRLEEINAMIKLHAGEL